MLSRGTRHALFAVENMGIIDYMANIIENGTEYFNIVTIQVMQHSQSCEIDARYRNAERIGAVRRICHEIT